MSGKEFLNRLGMIAGGILLMVALFYFAAGTQGYRLYAWPVSILLALPFLSRAMYRRMLSSGPRPRWRWLLIVPLALILLIRIGYWLTFFATPDLATLMHVAFNQVHLLAGPLLRVPEAACALLAAWFLLRLTFFANDQTKSLTAAKA